ncbi:MAG: universal stress protein [Ekhidna sp.]|nr:universal stress protein [Ekhidna sp.]
MKNILVPVDFSKVSEAAAWFAIKLAKENNASVKFLNSAEISSVYHYSADYHFPVDSNAKLMIKEVMESIEHQMDRMVKEFDVEDVKVTGKVSPLGLLDSIKDEINESDIDLCVVGTTGSTGLEEFFIGSNTERIVRHVSCPVISIPQSISTDQIKKILVPLDLREIRSSFLKEVRILRKMFDCKLEFVWVKTPHNIENEDAVADELKGIFERFEIDNYSFFIVRSVFPSDGIFMEVENSKADMVAMATHARRGIAHWLSGSLTEDTVNHVHIPVWSFRINRPEKVIQLKAISKAGGTPEYRKIKPMTIL